ncbi:MAG: I78 family peptidase inhibitor [Rhodoblastus sp.]
MRRVAALAFLCVLGASGASACDAGKARFAVGRTYSPALAEQARAKAGATIVRQMIRGRPYTMEFSGSRLNLHTDGRGKVLSASCG